MQHLFRHMPRRDMQLLFSTPFPVIDYLVEHVRLAIRTWPWASKMGVPWSVFLDDVVPYAVVDELRDVTFRYSRWLL